MADIKKLIKDINKRFGANAIRLGSDIKQEMNFKIPLGSDILLLQGRKVVVNLF